VIYEQREQYLSTSEIMSRCKTTVKSFTRLLNSTHSSVSTTNSLDKLLINMYGGCTGDSMYDNT